MPKDEGMCHFHHIMSLGDSYSNHLKITPLPIIPLDGLVFRLLQLQLYTVQNTVYDKQLGKSLRMRLLMIIFINGCRFETRYGKCYCISPKWIIKMWFLDLCIQLER